MSNPHINTTQSPKYYHKKIAALVSKYAEKESSILDVGCGLGNMLINLHGLRKDLHVDIADAYEECIEKTSSLLEVRNKYLLPKSSFDLSSINQHYQVIIMSHILEHIPEPLDAINQALRLLDKDGILIIAVPNPVTPRNFLSACARVHNANRGHCFHWDRSHWINFLENIAQLNVLEYDQDEVAIFRRSAPTNSLRVKLSVLLAELFPWWTFSHIAVAKK